MKFDTSIYGRVSIPVSEDDLPDLASLRIHRPRLRVEVKRGAERFLMPLQSLILNTYADIGYDIRRLCKLAFA